MERRRRRSYGHCLRVSIGKRQPRIRYLVAKGDVVIVIWDRESIARDGTPYQNQYVWVFRMREPQLSKSRCFSTQTLMFCGR
jgi:ketosteroid isomerase-like protein